MGFKPIHEHENSIWGFPLGRHMSMGDSINYSMGHSYVTTA